VDTHQESIAPFDCLALRTDTVVMVAHAHARVVVVVAPAEAVVVARAREVVVVARARAAVVVQVVAPGAPWRNGCQSGSREMLR